MHIELEIKANLHQNWEKMVNISISVSTDNTILFSLINRTT